MAASAALDLWANYWPSPQRVQDAFLLSAGLEYFLAAGTPALDGGVRVAQCQLEQGLVEGVRCPRFSGQGIQ